MLCDYKYIFGKPREGFHKARIPFLDMALWDTVGTVLLIILLCYLTKVNWIIVLLFFTIIAVFFHALFCVSTKLAEYLPFILIGCGALLIIYANKQ